MPIYTITDKQTNQSLKVKGDSPPTEEEAADVFASRFKDLPAPPDKDTFNRNLGGDVIKPRLADPRTGLPMEDIDMEKMASAAATGVRYGVPLGVAVLTAPSTAGTSIGAYLAALGTGSLINAGTSGLTEGAADFLEGKDLSLRRMASAGIRGSTPFLSKGGAAFMMAANTAASIGTNEIARFMENDPKNKDQNKLLRFGVPVVSSILTSGISSRSQSQVAAEEGRKALSGSRFGGPVTLSELKPEYLDFEANRIARGSVLARENLANMDANIGPAIISAFPEAGSSKQLSDDLTAMVGKLSETQNAWKTASAAYQESMGAVRDAVARNAENAPELISAARRAALEVEKAKLLHQGAINIQLGGNMPNLGKLAEGVRIQNLRATAQAAKDSTKASIGDLYDRADVGPNYPVVSFGGIEKLINSKSGKGKDFEYTAGRREMIEVIRDVFGGDKATPLTTLPREGMRELQAKFAQKLTKPGSDPVAVNRMAAKYYNVVREASDAFMLAKNPTKFAQYKTAQSAAAAEFAARKTGAMDLISDGDINGLVSLIQRQGATGVLSEIEAYANIIGGTFAQGNAVQSLKAADAFRNSVHESVSHALLDSATKVGRGSGFTDFRAINFNQLSSDMQSLATKGYPIGRLGMGSTDQIALLAKLGAKSEYGITVAEFPKLLEEVGQIGISAALARNNYRQAVRNSLIAGGAQKAGNKTARLLRLSKEAKMTEREAFNAYEAASKDPLVVFMDNTRMKVSSDPAGNRDFIDRIQSLDSETASGFMNALRASGRGADAEILKRGTLNGIMQDFGSAADGANNRANINKIVDFFGSNNPDAQRKLKTFEAIVGEDSMKLLRKNFIDPMQKIVDRRFLLSGGSSAKGLADQARGKAGTVGDVSIYGSFGQVLEMIQGKRYNMLHTLFLNPNTAPDFAAAGYVLDKFISKSPVNAIAIKLALQQDSDDQQVKKQ